MIIYDVFVNFTIIPLMILVGIYFSYKLNFTHLLQLRNVLSILKSSNQNNNNKNLSSFAALSATLGGNLGTGNISGVAVALATGGPASLFWMSIIICIVSVIKYVSCFLGIKYRIQNNNGQYVGGPMYYIKQGMSSPIIASLFAVLLLIGALTVGNLVQVNSLVLPITHSSTAALIYGLLIAFLIGMVTIGGLSWFSEVITRLVPTMAIVYLSSCLYILLTHYHEIIPAFKLIFNSTFNVNHISGGVLGYGTLHLLAGIKTGFIRGIFATDIGLGLEAILHSNVHTKNNNNNQLAIEQSIISVLSPFVVMIVCIITGLVLIVTGVWNDPTLESTNMCFAAFSIGIPSQFAGYIMLVTLFCFAFTTILTWMFCGNKAIEYLAPNNKYVMYAWKVFFILLLPIGAIAKVNIIWNLADIAISLMLFINLIALITLSKDVINSSYCIKNNNLASNSTR